MRRTQVVVDRVGWTAGGAVIGATIAFLLDPRRGAARRALVRDRVRSMAQRGGGALRGGLHDLQHRAYGVIYETVAALREEAVPDGVLVERVRARLGRPLSHAHAVDVHAHEGAVTLRGVVLSSELQPLLATIARVRGVRKVMSELRTAPGA